MSFEASLEPVTSQSAHLGIPKCWNHRRDPPPSPTQALYSFYRRGFPMTVGPVLNLKPRVICPPWSSKCLEDGLLKAFVPSLPTLWSEKKSEELGRVL